MLGKWTKSSSGTVAESSVPSESTSDQQSAVQTIFSAVDPASLEASPPICKEMYEEVAPADKLGAVQFVPTTHAESPVAVTVEE